MTGEEVIGNVFLFFNKNRSNQPDMDIFCTIWSVDNDNVNMLLTCLVSMLTFTN